MNQSLQPLEEGDRLPGLQGYDGLFPVGGLALAIAAHPSFFAFDVKRVDLYYADLEYLLHRVRDLDLVGILGDAESILTEVAQVHALLGEERPLDYLKWVLHSAASSSGFD